MFESSFLQNIAISSVLLQKFRTIREIAFFPRKSRNISQATCTSSVFSDPNGWPSFLTNYYTSKP